jgi:trehalose-phosphatase
MIPNAMERVEEWRLARARAGRLFLALDFDGTLAPIVPSPAAAALPAAARAALLRLAQRPDTDLAIVSGRALEDLRPRVGIPDLYYAGNHGLEIEGPGVQEVHQEATSARPDIVACAAVLRERLAGLEGAVLEDKGLTLSVHYRQAPDRATVERVRAVALESCAAAPGLRATEGKMVVEIRPAVDWDKGRAVRFLLEILGAAAPAAGPALFIGDDRTDEDAFRALDQRGDGVIVAPTPPALTAATAYLRSPAEVVCFLESLSLPAAGSADAPRVST